MSATSASAPYALRNLPFPAKLVVSAFLISVGIGYLSAIVQLHFQHAKAGQMLPTNMDARRLFHDRNAGKPAATENDDSHQMKRPKGQIEELITASAEEKFGGDSQMRGAFFGEQDTGYGKVIDKRAALLAIDRDEAKKIVANEREGERLALVEWLMAGGPEEAYGKDSFALPAAWKKDQPISAEFVAAGNPDAVKAVKIKSLIATRCARCHYEEGTAHDYLLDSYEAIKKYIPDPTPATKTAESVPPVPQREPAMSMTKLAQSTHVHLLGFSMLYGLTGLILAFSSYPKIVRVVLCPLPLVAQVVDISCWWLARLDKPYGETFADVIPITGAIVGAGLFLHLILSLLNLYNWSGKLVLVLLMVGAGAGGYVYVMPIVEKALNNEKPPPAAGESNKKADGDKKPDKKDGEKPTKDKSEK